MSVELAIIDKQIERATETRSRGFGSSTFYGEISGYTNAVTPQGGIQGLAAVCKALNIYQSAAVKYPLRIVDPEGNEIKDHYLNWVLMNPNQWQNKNKFLSEIVFNILIYGNCFTYIESSPQGEITGLGNFTGREVFAYPSYYNQEHIGNRSEKIYYSYNDPVSLMKVGIYYKDYLGRRWKHEDGYIAHFKDTLQNGYNMLNTPPRLLVAREAANTNSSVNEAIKNIADQSLISPSVFERPRGSDNTKTQETIDKLKEFYGKGIKEQTFVTLPEGWVQKNFNLMSFDKDTIKFLKNLSDKDIMRIYGIENLHSVETSGPQSSVKEVLRNVTANYISPFLDNIAATLTRALLTKKERLSGLCFKYETDIMATLDKREVGTYLSNMKKAGILTANDCRKKLGLPDKEGGDELVSEKVEVEKEKSELLEDKSLSPIEGNNDEY